MWNKSLLLVLGPYSLSDNKSYRQISWRLGAARFGFSPFQSLWYLTGVSAALLPMSMSRALRWLLHPISRFRDFMRYCGKMSVRLVNRGPGSTWAQVIAPWWRHQMETFSASLAICAGNSPATGEFPAQRPVTRGFDDFFDLRPNKRLSK